jgi:phosphohistidine phosphatase
MLLYIVRHAQAGEHGDPRYPDDSLRPLTKEGRKRFAEMVEQLAKRDFAPEIIASSPFVRCQQTAEIIDEKTKTPSRIEELSELAPGSELESLIAWTNNQGVQSAAWVGHAPDVDRLTAGLISSSDVNIRFTKGAIAAIEFADEIIAGIGELRWFVTAKILGC